MSEATRTDPAPVEAVGPFPFAFLVAAVGGTMPEMPVKATRTRYTAFLRRGYIRCRVKRKIALTCLKMRNRGHPNLPLCLRRWTLAKKPALFAVLAASGAL